MPRRLFSILKLSLILTVLFLAGIGMLWGGDIVSKETAGAYARTTLAIMGAFTLGMLAVGLLGGGSGREPGGDSGAAPGEQ